MCNQEKIAEYGGLKAMKHVLTSPSFKLKLENEFKAHGHHFRANKLLISDIQASTPYGLKIWEKPKCSGTEKGATKSLQLTQENGEDSLRQSFGGFGTGGETLLTFLAGAVFSGGIISYLWWKSSSRTDDSSGRERHSRETVSLLNPSTY